MSKTWLRIGRGLGIGSMVGGCVVMLALSYHDHNAWAFVFAVIMIGGKVVAFAFGNLLAEKEEPNG